MTSPKIVVHTDLFLDFLKHDRNGPSVLRLAMQEFFCYTTVFNAIELFSVARSDAEYRAIEHAMSAMKILGLNAKNAKRYGNLFSSGTRLPRMNTLIAGICLESKLPVLTGRPEEFNGLKELVVIPASVLGKNLNAGNSMKKSASHRRGN